MYALGIILIMFPVFLQCVDSTVLKGEHIRYFFMRSYNFKAKAKLSFYKTLLVIRPFLFIRVS